MSRRLLIFSFAVTFSVVSLCRPAVAQDSQQQSTQPAPSQSLGPEQVPNMPAYKQHKQKPSPATPEAQPQASQPQPQAPATPPPAEAQQPAPPAQGAMPATNATIQNQPPAEAPLPPAPPLPVPPPPPAQSAQVNAMPPYHPVAPEYVVSPFGSTYIPLDSWIYPAMLRLYSLGYLDSAWIGIRPWTRLSALHMLARCADKIDANEPEDSEARRIYNAVRDELSPDETPIPGKYPGEYTLESVYTRALGITGTSFNILDSYSVGQTIVNDFGRPYAEGFNNVTGFSARAQQGRFSFYFRGEYQHAPGWTGYDASQALYLQGINGNISTTTPSGIPTSTVPIGTIASQDNARILETDLAVHLAGHEISVGKHDEWLGPSQGGSFAYSNNAENIYAFQINRVEPLYIPFLSKVLGPVRYVFFVGSLKGHSIPNDPWVHVEKFSFRPTENFEFGFDRDVIWGGKNHEGISFPSFFRSFFSTSDTTPLEKCLATPENPNQPIFPSPHLADCRDPGARFSQFDWSYRLPGLRKWITWTVDSFVHDDVTPISAPRRSAWRTGLYLSQFPGAHKLDLRVEAASTDPDTARSSQGQFFYFEQVQHEGTTNKGVLFTDVIGREDKGGNAWLTYHFNPKEQVQFFVRTTKAAKDYIPGGTTQNDYGVDVRKRLGQNVELHGWFQYEHWVAPFVKPGPQSDTSTAVQITWFPKLEKNF